MKRDVLALIALPWLGAVTSCPSQSAGVATLPVTRDASAPGTTAQASPSQSGPSAEDFAPPAHGEASARSASDWCLEGLEELEEEICYVLPDETDGGSHPTTATTLLVYLHGIVPPTPTSPQKEAVERAVLHAAKRAGAAAIVPRGVRGIGPAGSRDWWAWPTEPSAYARHAPTLIGKWTDARRHLETIQGAPFTRTYLAGSSNGAYFVTELALRGDMARFGLPIDGYGAISGGSPGGHFPSPSMPPPRPFYVGFGAYDETTRSSARALIALLSRAGWPIRAAEHPVGHGVREAYLDEAFTFWAQQTP